MEKRITMNDIKKWCPLDKINNADAELFETRIKGAYEVELPHKILTVLPYIGRPENVIYEYPELVALCPVTFFPDIYNLKITIIPNRWIPELKSLKYYYMDYYHLPISHEHLASKIYADIHDQLNPTSMKLELIANVRGGILSTVKLGDNI